jgi:hypothetical protein
LTTAVKGSADSHITLEDSRLGHAIIGSQSTVHDMVEMIVMFLSNNMTVPSQHLDMISKKIEEALTDLKTTHSRGAAEPKKSDSTHSSWEYRPLLTFPHPHRRGDLRFVVTTIHITADINEESEWWNLAPSTSKKFVVVISAMTLAVQKELEAQGKDLSRGAHHQPSFPTISRVFNHALLDAVPCI